MRSFTYEFEELGLYRSDGYCCGSFDGTAEIIITAPASIEYEAWGDTYAAHRYGATWTIGEILVEWCKYDREKGWQRMTAPPPLDVVKSLGTALLQRHSVSIEEKISAEEWERAASFEPVLRPLLPFAHVPGRHLG